MNRLQSRVQSLRGWAGAFCALLSGMVLALGQAPYSLPALSILALPVILWRLEGAATVRNAVLTGWLIGVGYFGLLLSWLVEPFMIEPEVYGWMAPFALVGMAGGLALFWALAFGAARRLCVSGRSLALLLACCWTLSEYGRSHVFTGFPWGLIAYIWVDTPVIQAVSVVGPHGIGFLTFLTGLLAGQLTLRSGAVSLGLFALCLTFGIWQLNRTIPDRTNPLRVRIVQPNVAQHLKWLPENQQMFFGQLLDETAKPVGQTPDVVIWPETAVPYLLGENPGLMEMISSAAGETTDVVLGIRRREQSDGTENWYNSLAVVEPGGQVVAKYDKHHLVPFGEYLPFGEMVRGLGIRGLTGTGFSAGPGPVAIEAGNLPRFLPLICYEAVFPHGMRAPGNRPEWMVQVTNDAWFGKYSGPQQHFVQSRVRAVEQGLPLVRAANTGISAIVDARGRVVSHLNLGAFGSIDADLPNFAAPTPYSRLGDLPAVIAVVLIFILTLLKVIGGISGRDRQ